MDLQEPELARQLADLGCEVGRSKNGRLLRVDQRQCPDDLDPAILRRILGCTALKELYLRNSREFINERIGEIASLPKLKVLDIEASDITDDSLARLADCPSLQILNIRQTGVSESRVAALRKIMINTRIIF